MTKKQADKPANFGIATVSQLTGISQHLLRIWEKRYGAVKLSRTDTGRRLYTESDVERLLLIKALVDSGEPVGKVAALPDAQLKDALSSLRDTARARSRLRSKLKVAVLGDYLPTQLQSAISRPEQLEIVSSSTSIANFRADIRRLRPDALVVELAVFNQDSEDFLQELKQESGARAVVVAYRFGRREEVDAARGKGFRPVRSPSDLEQVYEALLQEPVPEPRIQPAGSGPDDSTPVAMTEVPGRRFAENELARLANASSTVECECPTHLVDLVINLTAFEAYSAACESRNDKDAALHAYLHATTANVRATLEEALERVAKAEGLLD